MTQLPFMSIPVPDLLGETTTLDTEEFGAYALLLCALWLHGTELPNDDEVLRKCARLTRKKWQRIKPQIWGFFSLSGTVDNPTITQNRLRQEYERAIQKSTRLALNGAKGGQATALKTNKQGLADALAGLGPHSANPQGRAASRRSPDGSPPIPIKDNSLSKEEYDAARASSNLEPLNQDDAANPADDQVDELNCPTPANDPGRLIASLKDLEARKAGKR